MLKKLSLLLFVAVVIVGGIYAVQALADNGSGAAVNAKPAPAVQTPGQSAGTVAQCPGHADRPHDCGHTGKCTTVCPKFKDEDKDGKCDQQGTCHSAGGQKGCPGHATSTACPKFTDNDKDGKCDQQGKCHTAGTHEGCPGHTGGGCGQHR